MEVRIKSLQKALKTTENPYEQEVLAERLSKLDGGVAVIKVGGATESESKEKRDRCEDAVLSVKCSQSEGILPGGGIALLRCSEQITPDGLSPEELKGFEIVVEALKAPLKQILANGSYDEAEILTELSNKEQNYGFDAMNGKFVDMLKAEIVDPAKVVRQAIINASSLAGTMLTCSGTIVNRPEGGKQ